MWIQTRGVFGVDVDRVPTPSFVPPARHCWVELVFAEI